MDCLLPESPNFLQDLVSPRRPLGRQLNWTEIGQAVLGGPSCGRSCLYGNNPCGITRGVPGKGCRKKKG